MARVSAGGDEVTLSPHNQQYLTFLKDIYEVSNACATVTYIWGGFTSDTLRVGSCESIMTWTASPSTCSTSWTG